MNIGYGELTRQRAQQGKIASGREIDARPIYGPFPGEFGYIPPMRVVPTLPSQEEQRQKSAFEQEKQNKIRDLQTKLLSAQNRWQQSVKEKSDIVTKRNLENELLSIMRQIDEIKQSEPPAYTPPIRSQPIRDTY